MLQTWVDTVVCFMMSASPLSRQHTIQVHVAYSIMSYHVELHVCINVLHAYVHVYMYMCVRVCVHILIHCACEVQRCIQFVYELESSFLALPAIAVRVLSGLYGTDSNLPKRS